MARFAELRRACQPTCRVYSWRAITARAASVRRSAPCPALPCRLESGRHPYPSLHRAGRPRARRPPISSRHPVDLSSQAVSIRRAPTSRHPQPWPVPSGLTLSTRLPTRSPRQPRRPSGTPHARSGRATHAARRHPSPARAQPSPVDRLDPAMPFAWLHTSTRQPRASRGMTRPASPSRHAGPPHAPPRRVWPRHPPSTTHLVAAPDRPGRRADTTSRGGPGTASPGRRSQPTQPAPCRRAGRRSCRLGSWWWWKVKGG